MPKYKNLIIFGATGMTGQACIGQALKLGHEVTAFTRDPSKLGDEIKDKVTVKQGDVLDRAAVEDAMKGHEAVISVLGTGREMGPTTVMSEGIKNILSAMEKRGIKRISVQCACFQFWDRAKVPPIYSHVNEDHHRVLDCLTASKAEWIALLPPALKNIPGTGKYIIKHEAGIDGPCSIHDIAHFHVTGINDDVNLYHRIGIVNIT
ncbi:unnamed protein product [Meganyctiphanes norvegica]|uniref:NAD(P)-binding domain-containing protein n=1 Tax=Meganyctiphanes norvegica TaxID=48144 RepID=A0AAV2PM75_MEGNR